MNIRLEATRSWLWYCNYDERKRCFIVRLKLCREIDGICNVCTLYVKNKNLQQKTLQLLVPTTKILIHRHLNWIRYNYRENWTFILLLTYNLTYYCSINWPIKDYLVLRNTSFTILSIYVIKYYFLILKLRKKISKSHLIFSIVISIIYEIQSIHNNIVIYYCLILNRLMERIRSWYYAFKRWPRF